LFDNGGKCSTAVQGDTTTMMDRNLPVPSGDAQFIAKATPGSSVMEVIHKRVMSRSELVFAAIFSK